MHFSGFNLGQALVALAVLIIFTFSWLWYRWHHQRRFIPRLRENPFAKQAEQPLLGDQVWYCPQCFETSGQPGACSNDEHATPVQMVRGSFALLEKYNDMRRLVNPGDD